MSKEEQEAEKLKKWIKVLDKLHPSARGDVNSLMIGLDLDWISVDVNNKTNFHKGPIK